jgi:hypothetical protein
MISTHEHCTFPSEFNPKHIFVIVGESSTTLTEDIEEVGECLRQEIRRAKSLTSKPFGVNFPIGGPDSKQFCHRCVEVAIEEKIPVA